MDLEKITDFIVKQSGYSLPFRYKLFYRPESIKKEDLYIKGDLDLRRVVITSLPEGLEVGGDLDLSDTNITSLPDNLEVGGDLDLSYSNIKSLPNDLKVGKHIFVAGGMEIYFIKNFPKFADQIR